MNAVPARFHISLVLLLLALLGSACAGTSASPQSALSQSQRGEDSRATGAPKRIVAAIRGTTPVLYRKLAIGATYSGLAYLELLVNAGLVTVDPQGAIHAQIAEAVPSLENGLWKIFPDGRMETTWRIKPGTKWHDGTPLSAEDLVFTARVEQDKTLAWNYNIAYDALDTITAVDPSTLTVAWKQPFVEADLLFAPGANPRGLPLPKHLLEQAFEQDRASFLQLPYWGPEFVATGPYKLREMAPDERLVLAANDSYILGRPKIDEIEVRFIPDSNTVIANIMAGEIHVTVDERAVSFEEARGLKEQWRGGRIEMGPGGVPGMQAQFLAPRPPIVADARFRRALFHAIDRQEMVDTIQGGLAAVAHSHVGPDMVEYPHVERSIVRYEFDPRKASQMIEALGYAKGSDGFFRDAAGERLTVESRATVTVINQKAMLAVADYWQRIGVGAETSTIPLQRQNDLEYMVTFGSFLFLRGGRDLTAFQNQHSSRAATPERNFAGINRSRYMSPEYDALIDRYFLTVPFPERMQVLGQIIHHETDQLPRSCGCSTTRSPSRYRIGSRTCPGALRGTPTSGSSPSPCLVGTQKAGANRAGG
jgi:peptide/nickel transport system substrate-binding protein